MAADTPHQRNVRGARPQLKERSRVTTSVLPKGPMTLFQELRGVGAHGASCSLHRLLLLGSSWGSYAREAPRPHHERALSQRGYTNRLTNSSALSQTSRQPLSIVSE